jgi:hypothetical protein
MLRRTLAAAALVLAAAGCQPAVGPRVIQQTTDTREVWIWMQAKEPEKTGIYRCYDNGGKPQCVRVELTTALIPSKGFCETHYP